MQKKLIALAVAGLVSGAAFAQSNVTIYGAMDATYDNVKASGSTSGTGNYESRGRTTMNSSYIGFKGAESIGNGLTAVFQIETGVGENSTGTTNFNSSQSTYGWANRDTMIALAGSFGTIAAGNLTGPARALGAAMDVNAGGTGIGANTALLGKLGGGGGASAFDTRFANAIAYISPTFSGFYGVVAYIPNENRSATPKTTSTVDTSGYTVGLNYNNGPIMVGYAWTFVKDSGSTLSDLKLTDNRVAGKYDFGMGTVGLMWDQPKVETLGVTLKQNIIYIPVTFKMGSGKLIAQYGQAGELKGATNASDYKANHFEIGYEYSLSKRTLVKALYSQITNKSAANFDYLYGFNGATGVAAGADPQGISIGLRHSF